MLLHISKILEGKKYTVLVKLAILFKQLVNPLSNLSLSLSLIIMPNLHGDNGETEKLLKKILSFFIHTRVAVELF